MSVAPADRFGLGGEDDLPRDRFLARELPARSLAGAPGLVRFPAAFAEVGGAR